MVKNSIEYILSEAHFRSRAFPLKNERKFIIKYTSLYFMLELIGKAVLFNYLFYTVFQLIDAISAKVGILSLLRS